MSLPGCAIDSLVAWPVMRELAERVDALAVTLNTPSYSPLVDIVDAPFQFTDKVDSGGNFYQSFTLSSGSVTARKMTSDSAGTTAFALPDVALDGLIDHEELYFLADADDCLCKTLYKVLRVTGGHTLSYAGGHTGCCQTLDLPEVGENILSCPHIFPTNFTLEALSLGIPANPTSFRACAEAADATAYYGGELDGGTYEVTQMSRSILGGYFTWPFKKRYMELILDRINFILQCENNDGVAPSGHTTPDAVVSGGPGVTLWVHGEEYAEDEGVHTSEWFKTGSTCPTRTADQWFASLWFETTFDDAENGTLVYGAAPETVSSGKPDDSMLEEFTRPWDSPTPATGEACDPPNLPKVYAYTLNSLADLVDQLELRVWPYGTFDPPEVITCEGDEDEVYCCGFPDVKGNMTRKECAVLGGVPATDEADCCDTLETECTSGSRGRICGEPADCSWNEALCTCDCPNFCADVFVCCCPGATILDDACQDPSDPSDLGSCPPGCTAVINCNASIVGACCYLDGSLSTVLPVGMDCSPDEFDVETFYCETIATDCDGSPVSYPPSYTPEALNVPEYPDLPTCTKPCCLTHPVFEHGDKNCLQYLEEIEDFLNLATDGMFYTCRWKDLRYVDPENPSTSAVEDCSTIACGLLCDTAYAELIDTPEHPVITCLDQAPMMYSFDRRSVLPDDTTLLDYYDILITAPTPIP